MTQDATVSALAVQIEHAGRWVDVGHLRRRDDTTTFTSEASYWSLAHRPVLGQVFEQRGPTWAPSATTALPRWFSHLLSEGRLREAASQALGIHPSRELPLLAALGANDLPGAVRVLPADDEGAPIEPDRSDDVGSRAPADPVLKFSLAGLQLKFSLTRGARGLTVPASGTAGDVILKLPDPRPGHSGVPEAEMAAMSLARAAGLDVPETWLVDAVDVVGLEQWPEVGAGPSFAIERFDRTSGGRRHSEEFAQVLDISATDPWAKYFHTNFETVANVVARFAGLDQVAEVVRRIVLNVLVGNGDAHLKNWGFVYPDGQNPRLGPLYDVLPTVLYVEGDDLGLNLGGTKAFSDIDVSSFDRMGEKTGLGVGEIRAVVSDGVQRVTDHWNVLGEHLPAARHAALTRRLSTLPIARSGP